MLSEIPLLAFTNRMDDIITVVPATSGLRWVVMKTRESGPPRRDSMLYLLTPCSRVLLEKLTGSQLVKKFPAFYWTRRFIKAFTSARHLSLYPVRSIKSMPPPPNPTSWRSILILSSRLYLGTLSGLFPLGLPCRHLSHTCYMPRPSQYSRFDHPSIIRWTVQIITLLIMQLSPLPCYLVPLRPKYFPQHPILKHPHPTSLPHCQRPSFIPIQNNRQNYSSVYINLCVLNSKVENKRFCSEW